MKKESCPAPHEQQNSNSDAWDFLILFILIIHV